jgi:hypothetical protein
MENSSLKGTLTRGKPYSIRGAESILLDSIHHPVSLERYINTLQV